ncbi:MAG: four-carbon acid sugar kinase family protein [Peptococcaceae bacterium]|nr:four-carbon acid sugar kinase family protein [Peptococcaceae bacterium]
MAEFAVVADDLTGANGSGVLLVNKGFRVLSIVHYERLNEKIDHKYDGVVVNTCSRGIPSEEAKERVLNAIQVLKTAGIQYFGKRIDSTLRGNLGAEIEGALSGLDSDYIALVVPAYPSLGRVTAGGYLLVNGIPVQQTDAGKDPKTPILSSLVTEEIARQTSLPLAFIHLDVVLQGPEKLKEQIKAAAAEQKKIIIIDATTDGHIACIAQAVKDVRLKCIAVDPGPLSEKLISLWLEPSPKQLDKKVMVVSGSASALTISQLNYLQEKSQAIFEEVDVNQVLYGLSETEESRLVKKIIKNSQTAKIFGLKAISKDEVPLNLENIAVQQGKSVGYLAEQITKNLARLAKKVLESGIENVTGVYLTGGDMAVDFCQAIGAQAIELKGQIMPLVSYGVIVGGEFSGLRVITKGGLVGSQESAYQCINYLFNHQV